MNTDMTIHVHSIKQLKHQVERGELFIKGLRKHGFTKVKHLAHNAPAPCDLAVFWGMHYSTLVRKMQEDNKRNWLIMERGYVGDRFHWTSMGYNGLNGHADFVNKNMPPDRWNALFGHHLKEWHDGKYVLITGQVRGDASIKHLSVNYDNIVARIKEVTTLPIQFRPHPQRGTPVPRGAQQSRGDLAQSLAQAKVVVTINSNTSVDAILAGTPCIVRDKGSMAWDVCGHEFADIKQLPTPDRTQWCNNLAYTQWSPEEIEDGTAWNHLKRKFEQ